MHTYRYRYQPYVYITTWSLSCDNTIPHEDEVTVIKFFCSSLCGQWTRLRRIGRRLHDNVIWSESSIFKQFRHVHVHMYYSQTRPFLRGSLCTHLRSYALDRAMEYNCEVSWIYNILYYNTNFILKHMNKININVYHVR